jgi:hypothetical protein
MPGPVVGWAISSALAAALLALFFGLLGKRCRAHIAW